MNIITNSNFPGADPVASAIALKLTNAIKVKCTQEECLAILREIPDDEPDQTVNPTRVGFLGSQSLLYSGDLNNEHLNIGNI